MSAPGRQSMILAGALAIIALLSVAGTLYEILAHPVTPTADYFIWIESVSRLIKGDSEGLFFMARTYHPFIPIIPLATFAANALLFSWSPVADLLFGCFLAVVKIAIVSVCFFDRKNPWRCLSLFLVLLSLQFSATHFSVLGWGVNTICWQWATLGFALGLLGVVKPKNDLAGAALMVAGGVAASYSLGNILPCWIALLAALLLLRRKAIIWWPAWIAGLSISMAQYLFLPAFKKPSIIPFSPERIELFFRLLGQQMCNYGEGTSALQTASFLFGITALAALLVLFALNIRTLVKREADSGLAAGIAMAGYALASAVLITLVRETAAPWYVEITGFLWWALVCILARPGAVPKKPLAVVLSLWLAGAFLFQLRAFRTNDWFACSRSPAAASTLEHFDTAPTTSIEYLNAHGYESFAGGASCLQEMGYMCFRRAPHRRLITLQGEFFLPSVRTTGTDPEKIAGIAWVDKKGEKMPPSSSKDLDLRLPRGCTLTWDLKIPEQASGARLIAGYSGEKPAMRIIGEKGSQSDALSFSAAGPDSLEASLGKGDRTVEFHADSGDTLLLHPRVVLDGAPPPVPALPPRPANTDLSPDFPGLRSSPEDLLLPAFHQGEWVNSGMTFLQGRSGERSSTLTVESNPQFYLKTPLNLDLSGYQYMVFTTRQDRDAQSSASPATAVQLVLNDTIIKSVLVPLLLDGKSHSYSIDLDVLYLPKAAPHQLRLSNIIFLPAYGGPVQGKTIEAGAIRLLRGNRSIKSEPGVAPETRSDPAPRP
ncbi:MAG: hypothetical protein KC777_04120 [Cyanobacteria bacterium HKST-UBA02]|nr:hypothetical protein [Cyanobacteria bacterium HKST-UBA02]